MKLNRRNFLRLAGGGIVVAAGAYGGFAATRRPDQALAPWAAAGTPTDPRLAALSYAILAPNPHNLQPWMAELSGDATVILHRDPTRNLPETDPFDRQLTIGMGCFLEVMRIAAAQNGHTLQTDLFPQGEDGPVARITFAPGATPDPLFAQILHRRTNRQAYDDRAIPAADVAALRSHGDILTDPAQVAPLRDLTWTAWMTEVQTHRTHMESVNVMRFGKAEINANPDGIALGGPFLETLMLVGQLSREGQADSSSSQFQQTLNVIKPSMDATFAYAVVRTPGNTRRDQIEAGRVWVRMQLDATARGLSMQPVSQALQEYPEQAEYYAQVHDMLAEPGETVQMLGRLGYGPSIDPSPRWPLDTRMVHA
ncbi:twin-arginine translocation pathway signal protein [Actibacterium mucosum KCTC 23349]|uniref:Twin-arginine translocation pathway signal protein n=1 Tax=Actibacterium mucosum KCTC 23349 TaxID=1454373 RepID=A0A037ZK34_9RHOB|nr:hypothetical protein [Actibacterium mucosum]KAJ55989.1 twin-arginine translocation pathway signal protein [Actibacterium mucosum KCTC 23349]